MGRHLVLVGGGHAHMVTLANVRRFVKRSHRVTVIGPSVHHYYSGMGPGLLGGTYAAEEIRFATRRIVERQGGRFVCGAVQRIDPEDRRLFLDTGETVAYDVASFNVGSIVRSDTVRIKNSTVFPVKPIETLLRARNHIRDASTQRGLRIGVVGGGPAAAEIAGNIGHLVRGEGIRRPTVTILTARRFMDSVPEAARRCIARHLARHNIGISEHDPVTTVRNNRIETKAGRSYEVDITFLAMGISPTPIFRGSGLPTGPDGGLSVNRYLQSCAYPELFGGGDCIHFADHPLAKVGVHAVRESPILCYNLMATLEERPLRPFSPRNGYLLILNVGDIGILRKGRFIVASPAIKRLKDSIDRRFMRRYQALE